MSTYLHPARDAIVLARVPAGAARVVADDLFEQSRAAERDGRSADAQRLREVAEALHAAGWQRSEVPT